MSYETFEKIQAMRKVKTGSESAESQGSTPEGRAAIAECARINKEHDEGLRSGLEAFEKSIMHERMNFEELVDAHMKQAGCSRSDAISAVARAYPEKHEEYIRRVNS